MKNIVAIQYTDAICFEEKPSTIVLPTYRCVGSLGQKTDEYIHIYFSLQDNHPQEGLIVPHEAIIFDNVQQKPPPALETIRKEAVVGVTWKDIVHFTEGKIPKTYSTMYTEGTVVDITENAVVLKEAQTIRIHPGTTRPHHKQNATPLFCLLPKQLITNVEIYE